MLAPRSRRPDRMQSSSGAATTSSRGPASTSCVSPQNEDHPQPHRVGSAERLSSGSFSLSRGTRRQLSSRRRYCSSSLASVWQARAETLAYCNRRLICKVSISLLGGMGNAIPVYLHLLRAKDLIDREYSRELDVPALAREAHASTAHFSRSFKRAFGETPHQYLQQRRIERAKELLRGTELSVTDVSLAVGFQSLGSFSTLFRKLVGEPPSEYARQWRGAGPPPIPACFTLMYTRPVESSSSQEASLGS